MKSGKGSFPPFPSAVPEPRLLSPLPRSRACLWSSCHPIEGGILHSAEKPLPASLRHYQNRGDGLTNSGGVCWDITLECLTVGLIWICHLRNIDQPGLFILFVTAKAMWEKTKLKEVESSNPSREICLASIFLLSITAKIWLIFVFPTLWHYLSKGIIDHRGFLNLSASSVFLVFKWSLKIFVQWRFTYSKQLFASKYIAFLPFLLFYVIYFLHSAQSLLIFFSCIIILILTLDFFKLIFNFWL